MRGLVADAISPYLSKIQQRLREWRSNFGTLAIQAVDLWAASLHDEMNARGEEPTEQIGIMSDVVNGILGRDPDASGPPTEEEKRKGYAKDKRFYWKVWEDGGKVKQVSQCYLQ